MDEVKDTVVGQSPITVEGRNYQIDVLKMIMAVFVFVNHTVIFLDLSVRENLEVRYSSFGWVSVHVFLIISGFLMMKSLSKRNYDQENAGRNTIRFIIDKFKPIALPYWIANAMFMFMYIAYYIYIYIYDETKIEAFQSLVGDRFKSPIDLIVKVIPEALCITNVGGMRYPWNNSTSWYISHMLFVMIVLVYLVIKKRDLFVNVLSLIISILLLGYCKNEDYCFDSNSNMLRLIRAICGLCFGVVAWNIYNKINELKDTKQTRILLTIAELFIYSIFFAVLVLKGEDAEWVFPMLLLMPIAIAITFSKKSYLSSFFKARCLKHLGTVSLYVYLNHNASTQIVRAIFPDKGYVFCVFAAVFITVILCLANYIAGRIIKRIFRVKT